jgi:hypothetical protein
MTKLVFYDVSQFDSYSNIKIKFNKLKEENLIFYLDETQIEKKGYANYLSVVRDPDSNKIYLYYSNDTKVPFMAKTCLAISDDGITFKKETLNKHVYNKKTSNNILLDEKCLSNNLYVFYDTNPNTQLNQKWKGIGGLHISWWYIKDNTSENDLLRNILPKISYINLKPSVLKTLSNSNDIYKLPHPAFERYRKAPSKGNVQDPDQTTMFLYIDPRIPDPTFRGNGIHLITSHNGLEWNLNYNDKKPILSGIHDGHYDKLYICSHYDCHPSCFYDPNTKDYKMYLRSNVDYGVRHIQITTSKDLINWSPLKYINFDPPFDIERDNYYSANVMPYPEAKNLYIGFPPYFKNLSKNPKHSFISLAFSKDGYNWHIKDRLIMPQHIHKEKVSSFPASGLILSNDKTEFYFYEHRYRSKIIPDKRPQMIRHSIRRDGFTSIESPNGYIIVEITISKKILLNFKTNNDGYITISFANKNNEIFYNSLHLTGNHLDYVIDDFNQSTYGEKGFLRINLYNAQLFCIDLVE